jgi:hypothetical protein
MDLINFRKRLPKEGVSWNIFPDVKSIDMAVVNIQMRINESIHANCSHTIVDHLNRFGDFPRHILEYSYNTVKEFCDNNP